MNRNKVGQFVGGIKTRIVKFIKKTVLPVVGVVVAFYVVGIFGYVGSPEKVVYAENPVAYSEVEREVKARLQDKILAELASCETRGVQEPTAAIIFDTNNQASIGKYQWQIKSVQHYYQVLNGQKITRTEAIKVAIDEEKATELTRAVLFTSKDGYKNWLNCANKLGLKDKIELVK